MLVSSAVVLTETSYIGALGTNALAGMALVFPMVMLQGMLSGGAMGGGVSSAISRALGAGDTVRANALVLHAAIIGLTAGLLFMFIFLMFGERIYGLLGGKDIALREALSYSNVVFLAVVPIWLNNTFASVIRGTGNMRVPSLTLIFIAALQVPLSGALGLGWGPFPQLGMAGVALGAAIANTLGTVVFGWLLLTGQMRVRLSLRGLRLRSNMFFDILKVGAFALLGPLQSISTILVLTALMSRQGTEVLAGYGVGIRLEFLLIPITFAIGVVCGAILFCLGRSLLCAFWCGPLPVLRVTGCRKNARTGTGRKRAPGIGGDRWLVVIVDSGTGLVFLCAAQRIDDRLWGGSGCRNANEPLAAFEETARGSLNSAIVETSELLIRTKDD